MFVNVSIVSCKIRALKENKPTYDVHWQIVSLFGRIIICFPGLSMVHNYVSMSSSSKRYSNYAGVLNDKIFYNQKVTYPLMNLNKYHGKAEILSVLKSYKSSSSSGSATSTAACSSCSYCAARFGSIFMSGGARAGMATNSRLASPTSFLANHRKGFSKL